MSAFHISHTAKHASDKNILVRPSIVGSFDARHKDASPDFAVKKGQKSLLYLRKQAFNHESGLVIHRILKKRKRGYKNLSSFIFDNETSE